MIGCAFKISWEKICKNYKIIIKTGVCVRVCARARIDWLIKHDTIRSWAEKKINQFQVYLCFVYSVEMNFLFHNTFLCVFPYNGMYINNAHGGRTQRRLRNGSDFVAFASPLFVRRNSTKCQMNRAKRTQNTSARTKWKGKIYYNLHAILDTFHNTRCHQSCCCTRRTNNAQLKACCGSTSYRFDLCKFHSIYFIFPFGKVRFMFERERVGRSGRLVGRVSWGLIVFVHNNIFAHP